MSVTARQARRARKKALKEARKLLPGFEPTLRHHAAADQAHAAYEQAARHGRSRRDEYDGLLDDLRRRGAPPDVLGGAEWLVDMARRFDIEWSPMFAATEEMAPTLGHDVNGMTVETRTLRSKIEDGIRLAARWQQDYGEC